MTSDSGNVWEYSAGCDGSVRDDDGDEAGVNVDDNREILL
jgi:hypothetical protein